MQVFGYIKFRVKLLIVLTNYFIYFSPVPLHELTIHQAYLNSGPRAIFMVSVARCAIICQHTCPNICIILFIQLINPVSLVSFPYITSKTIFSLFYTIKLVQLFICLLKLFLCWSMKWRNIVRLYFCQITHTDTSITHTDTSISCLLFQ